MRKTRESSSSWFEEKLFSDFKKHLLYNKSQCIETVKLWEDQITALDKQDEWRKQQDDKVLLMLFLVIGYKYCIEVDLIQTL